MYAEAIAISSAAFFGLAAILLKLGYRHSTPAVASIIVLSVNVTILWLASAAFVPFNLFLSTAVLFFVAGGLLAQGVARTLQYIGIDKVGPARNHTVLGTAPVFAGMLAIIFLKETLSLKILAGTALVVIGVAILAWEKNGRKWQRKHLLFPLVAAAFYGAAAVVNKTGLEISPNAILAATTATTSGLAGLLFYSAFTQKISKFRPGKALPLFIAAGLANTAAYFLNIEALRAGNVTAVMPLIGTQPLFATVLSHIFLKGIEKITFHAILGAILVVAGAAIITAF
ncbi:DMT family transporter [Candidatus Woesearchaeota archaeon]|nr:DMT family transporter [Candidatus Woesearchaeota archaeon]